MMKENKDKVDKNKKKVFATNTALEDLEKEELSGRSEDDESISVTETDESENEGLGDGKLGKGSDDLIQK